MVHGIGGAVGTIRGTIHTMIHGDLTLVGTDIGVTHTTIGIIPTTGTDLLLYTEGGMAADSVPLQDVLLAVTGSDPTTTTPLTAQEREYTVTTEQTETWEEL